MRTPAVGGRVLDVPALLDAATGSSEYMRAWLVVMTRRGYTAAVPSAVRARASAQLTTATELAELDWFCSSSAVVEVPVEVSDAAELDQLAKDCFAGDTAAAHAALVARRRDWSVITSEARAPGFTAAAIDVEELP